MSPGSSVIRFTSTFGLTYPGLAFKHVCKPPWCSHPVNNGDIVSCSTLPLSHHRLVWKMYSFLNQVLVNTFFLKWQHISYSAAIKGNVCKKCGSVYQPNFFRVYVVWFPHCKQVPSKGPLQFLHLSNKMLDPVFFWDERIRDVKLVPKIGFSFVTCTQQYFSTLSELGT